MVKTTDFYPPLPLTPPSSSYRLRPLSQGDLDRVLDIEQQAYEFPWSRDIFEDCFRAGYFCWGCLEGNGLKGYGVMSVGAGECHILNLCITLALRRQGAGRYLLAHLLHLARRHGADTAFLEVRPSNQGALLLYHAMGFNEIGRRRGYYPARQGREDAIVLARCL